MYQKPTLFVKVKLVAIRSCLHLHIFSIYKKHSVPFLLLCHIILNYHSLCAQQHTQLWTRTSVHYPLLQKWTVIAEAQYRSNNSSIGYLPFKAHQMVSLRPWISYYAHKNILLNLSPLAWFNSYTELSPGRYINQEELRSAISAQHSKTIYNRCKLQNRLGAEYRNFYQHGSNLLRLRYKLEGLVAINSKLTASISNEWFVNHDGTFNKEHQRSIAGVSWQMSKKIKVESNYMFIQALPIATNKNVHAHALQLFVSYYLSK